MTNHRREEISRVKNMSHKRKERTSNLEQPSSKKVKTKRSGFRHIINKIEKLQTLQKLGEKV